MKRFLTAAAVLGGVVVGIATPALAFNPQPDPPKIAIVGDVSATTGVVAVQVQLLPPDICRIALVSLFPPDPCSPSTVTG